MSTAEPSLDRPASPRSVFLLAAVVVLAGVLAYASSFQGVFVLDDLPHIVNNPRFAHDGPLAALADPRPLVSLSLWFNGALDRALGGDGLNPAGYHAFNLVVHLIAGLALFGLVRRAMSGRAAAQGQETGASPPAFRSSLLAFAVALVWVVHPLTTQAVTYIIQRGESMMAMFFLLSMYCVTRGAGGERRWGWYAAAVVAGWLSCLSKQVAVVLPVVMLLYDRGFVAGTFAEALRRRWPVYGLLAVGSVVLAAWALLGTSGASAGFGMERISPWAYALTQPGVILHYLRLAAWPAPLVFDYGWPVAAQPWRIAACGAAVAAMVAAAGVALWRWPRAGFVAASFFLVLGPTSSIMPIADLAVEHRMYLPLAAVIALAVFGITWLLRQTVGGRWLPVGAAMLAGTAAALGAATFARNFDYHSRERLWRDTIAKVPDNPRAHHNLANVLFSSGQVEESIPAYQRALELEPGHVQARVNLGVALVQLGRIQEAEHQFEQALAVAGDYAPALNQLGILRIRGGDPNAAAALFRRAIEADPEFADAYVHLGHVYFGQGKSDEAAAAYKASLELRPHDAQVHNNLGISLAQLGRLPEAAEQFAQAVRLDPSFADAQANLQRARAMLRQPSP